MSGFHIIDAEQRSTEWFQARAGLATGSRAADIFATRRDGKEAASRRDYRTALVCERLTGQPQEDGYQNADMRRGIELEPAAFALYEGVTGRIVRRTGFVAMDDELIGASLDGDVEEFTGLVELKSPRPANHLAYIRADEIPTEHLYQMVHGQLVTGAQWTDFVSYCPAFPPKLQLFVKRLERDEKLIHSYRMVLVQFLAEVEAELAEVRRLMDRAA